jgi:hypothetical protein
LIFHFFYPFIFCFVLSFYFLFCFLSVGYKAGVTAKPHFIYYLYGTDKEVVLYSKAEPPIVISADSEVGDKFSITLPKAKYSKSEPDFNQSALMLAPNWNAEPVTGVWMLQALSKLTSRFMRQN